MMPSRGGDRHTRVFLRSLGRGRDPMHLLIDSQGSVAPKHSAFNLGLPFASRSIAIRICNIMLADTNRACDLC
jgi:hypothetical protein